METENILLDSVSSAGFKAAKDDQARAKVLVERGHTVRQIASVLDRGVGTIHRWISDQASSIQRGRPSLLNDEDERALLTLIETRALERRPLQYKDIRDQVFSVISFARIKM